jgi:hypothetical protein
MNNDARDNFSITLALAAFSLAVVAQFYLLNLRLAQEAVLLYGGALLAFFLLIWRTSLSSRFSEPARALLSRVRAVAETNSIAGVLVALAFLLDLTAIRMLQTKNMEDTHWDVFALWAAAILLFLIATLQLDLSGLISRLRTSIRSLSREQWIEVGLVVALTAVAFGLRFAALGDIPDIIDGDEGDLGLLAMRALYGEMRDMFATVYGYGTMYFFLLAVPLRIFGANSFGLRFVSALAGSLTVPVLFLFGRRLFDARVGFIAAALLTVSHYHLHFSRVIPAGNTLDALLAIIVLYLFYRGLEDRDRNSLILSGVILGLAQYLFVGSRLTGVIIIAYVGLLFLLQRRLITENFGGLALFTLAALLVSGPMIRWALDRPDDYLARMNQTGIIQTGWLARQVAMTGQPALLVLADQVRKAFLVFNYYPVTGFYNATIPVLDILAGGVFILGLGYSLLYILDRRFLLLNIWFWSGVVIGGALVLNTESGAYRIMAVFPVVALFTAIGLSKLLELGTQALPDRHQVALICSATFLILVAFFNLHYYFLEHNPQCRYGDPNTATAAMIGKYLRSLEPEYQGYFLGPPDTNISAYRNLPFLSGGRQVENIEQPLESASGAIDNSRPKVFFVRPQRAQELQVAREHYPGGSVTELRRCGDAMVTVYRVDDR